MGSKKVLEIEEIRELINSIQCKLDYIYDLSLYNKRLLDLEAIRMFLDQVNIDLYNIKSGYRPREK